MAELESAKALNVTWMWCTGQLHYDVPISELCIACHVLEAKLHSPSLHAGLTKVPIDGQPKSIVKDLEDMARTYIKVSQHRIK